MPMKYEILKDYSDEKFRRITGVKRKTFSKMLEILQAAHMEKHKRRGRKPKLCMEDMLLASLEYWREYRTYAHIAASFGIDESNIFRAIKWAEDVLIKDGTFALPGKKSLLQSDTQFEIVLVDVTESPIERPKRGSENSIQEKRSVTQ
jgi:hypothetical protein